MAYTITIHKDDKLIASRSASPDMAIALLAEMLNNNPDLAAIVDNGVEHREVGRVRKTTYRALEPKQAKGKKGKRKCSNCGQPGHMAKTCPTKRGAARRGEPKPCCGSTGTRHFKTCPNYGKEPIRSFAPESSKEERPTSKPLDGYQYDALRDAMHDRDFSSAQYALTNKLPPREVNAAIRSKDYDDYLDNR